MRDNRKQQLRDQMEDAAFALMMDEYAECEGARLLAEFAAAPAPAIPAGLDEKCLGIINRNANEKRRRLFWKKAARNTVKAAVVLFLTCGMILTTILSVEAWRMPFLKYLLESQGTYSVLRPEEHTPVETFHQEGMFQAAKFYHAEIGFVHSVMPQGYQQITCEYSANRLFSATYQNGSGALITYSHRPLSADYYFQTEDAQVVQTTLRDHDAWLATTDADRQIVWVDQGNGVCHTLFATNLTGEDFLSLAQALADHADGN